jgi:hypothetical protein
VETVLLPSANAIVGVGAAVMVKAYCDVAVVTPLPDALIVMEKVPGVALDATMNETAELAVAPVNCAGLKLEVTPVGRLLADSVTAPVYPPARDNVAVAVAVPPGATDADDAERLRAILCGVVGVLSLLLEHAARINGTATNASKRLIDSS